MKDDNTCITPGCGREVAVKKMRLCTRCYAWVRYWDGRLLEDKMERLHVLQYWAQRASFFFTPAAGGRRESDSRRKK